MPYYYRSQGDYRTGGYGYPQGDPGLLGFLGKIIKPIWKAVKPVVGGIIGGPVGAAIIGGTAGIAVGKALVPVATPQPPTSMPGAGMMVGQALGAAAAGYIGARPMGGLCPSGYHPAKDGSGRCVRNRRMNVANARALRRSMRRVKGFEKLARKTISFTKRVRIKS